VESHPKVGASWEGFVLREVIERLGARREEVFFWATHAGAELDLLVVRGQRRLGFELKRTAEPRVTSSIRTALSDLRLERVDLVYAGEKTFPLAERVRALALPRLYEDLAPLD
jgi:predicted AAA+ superfamily ATPase